MVVQDKQSTLKYAIFNGVIELSASLTSRAMDQVRLNKNEWETFLSEFLELSRKYERILTELDQTRAKITSLQQKTVATENGQSTAELTGPPRSERLEEPNRKRGLREFFRFKLSSTVNTLKPTNARLGKSTVPSIQCARCGYQITHPSRVCVRCGTSFGGLYCVCGRELKSNDKFCDGCGQKLLE